MAEYLCQHCKKPCEKHHNYCSWACHIESAKAVGGVAHTPNGLPITTVRRDGNMYEHEHGDHPDYKFPVRVNYVGKLDTDEVEEIESTFGRPVTEEEARKFRGEVHALIYTDGSIALTMYECCYALWYLRKGTIGGGSMWKTGEWVLNPEDQKAIQDYATSRQSP